MPRVGVDRPAEQRVERVRALHDVGRLEAERLRRAREAYWRHFYCARDANP